MLSAGGGNGISNKKEVVDAALTRQHVGSGTMTGSSELNFCNDCAVIGNDCAVIAEAFL